MANNPLKRHKNCPVKVIPTDKGPHAAYFYCVKHKKHIAWLSKQDYKAYQEIKDAERQQCL